MKMQIVIVELTPSSLNQFLELSSVNLFLTGSIEIRKYIETFVIQSKLDSIQWLT